MEIIIKIPKEDYERMKWTSVKNGVTNSEKYLRELILNGTPLPEHHGRIIDESQIRHIEIHTERELYGDKIRYVKVTDAPTIIEGSDSE